MPFCPECGKSVGAAQKFCRSCGASLIEESSAPAAPPAPPSGGLSCRACGAPLAPDEKFCGVCGTKTGDAAAVAPAAAAAPAIPVPVHQAPPPPPVYQPPPPAPVYQPPAAPAYQPPPPPPPQYAAPAPAAAPPAPGGLVCKACGNPIKPGDKFCSKCLVKVPDMPAAAPPAYQPPPPAPAFQSPPPPGAAAAPAPGGYTCASCGSPVSGSEKFCGICGAPVVAAKPMAPPAPPAPPAGKFCGVCGAPVSGSTKFCGSCGAAVTTAPPGGGDASFRPAVPVTPGGEEVIGVIANARKVKFLGASWDTWNIVVTNRRMIMVQMTSAMITAAVAEAQAKAKAEGKGFFAIMKDQMAAQFGYAVRYETMPPEQALAETAGNFALENSRITAINLKLKDTGHGDFEYNEFRISIESPDGRHEYLMAEDDRYINLLKQVYSDRVHMPFGYIRLGAARIKFF